MQQFILIDHSLRHLAGHHYPYAVSVLEAADRAGFRPVLATHRHFARFRELAAAWNLQSCFRHESYTPYSYSTQASVRHLPEREARSIWQRLRVRLGERARARLSSEFARGCEVLFARVPLAAGDHVFLAMASELDLAGLSQYLQRNDLPSGVHWHLQFHFGVYHGREPEYARQSCAGTAMRAALLAALAPLSGARLHFYCTTDPISRQYRQLGLPEVQTLPYPVHALFSAPQALRAAPRPARIACLGHGRREKGYGGLPQVLQQLGDRYLQTGRAQLVLQSARGRVRRALQAALPPASPGVNPLAFASSHLDLQRYAQLVRDSDIGLLLYDGRRYYDRCSGVLLEMLAAAVPVVVPAGSWLSEQIDPCNQQYLAEVAANAGASALLTDIPLNWHGSTANLCQQTVIADAELDTASGALLLQLVWTAPAGPGTYLRVVLEQRLDRNTPAHHSSTRIIGRGNQNSPLMMLFTLRPETRHITLHWSNAWQGEPLSVQDIKAQALRGAAPPWGSVGLTIADPSHAAEAISDILDHLAHYKHQSAQHSSVFALRQSADGVVAQLKAAELRSAP